MTNTIEKIKCLIIGWGPAGYTAPGTGCMAAWLPKDIWLKLDIMD